MTKDPAHRKTDDPPGNVLRKIDPICDAFEQLWRSGQRPELGHFLVDPDSHSRETLIRKLILIDLKYRQQNGEEPSTFDYFRHLPTDQKPILEAFQSFGLIGELIQPRTVVGLDSQDAFPGADGGACPPVDEPLPMMVRFRVIEGPHEGRKFEFTGHDNFIVGRASFAHFRLPREDRYFSRVHFMVEVNPPNCRLLDMGSRNGTRINGEKVGQRELKDGDRIRAGKTVIEVSIQDVEPKSEPIPPTRVAPAAPSLHADARTEPTEAWLRDADTRTHVDLQKGGGLEDPGVAPSLPAIAGYEMVRLLGKGGMGVVYLAHRTSDGMPVAIKMIKPAEDHSEAEIRRFLREASILQRLKHARIVEFQQMGEVADHLFFVMDYIPGCDARELVRRDGPLRLDLAVSLACQTLEGLSYAHQQGVVHRDVKPSNLLVGDKEEHPSCMLTDFGLARVYQASCLSGLTLMGEIAGTLPFMPPEQITNFRGTGPGCDQYSLAATLFYLLTGRHVFDFSKVPCEKRMAKILFEAPLRIEHYLPAIAPDLADAIHRGLEKNPQDRYADAQAFRTALNPFSN